MGTGEESTPAKPSKPASSTQEIPATPAYPDWSSSMQTPSSAPTNVELEGKGPEGNFQTSTKKSKGTSGGKVGDIAKAASGSGNDGSQSAESGSEGSSDASDENANQQEFTAGKKGTFKQMLADANAQSSTGEAVQAPVAGKPVVSMPTTNLNIGMDLWNASPATAGAGKMRPSGTPTAVVAPAAMIGREGIMPDQWIHDERELKRLKRKQSNRESARRSRLRKQAECEELQARVERLATENSNLRDELQRLSEEYEKLTAENTSIKEELTQICGAEAVANLEQIRPTAVPLSHPNEGNS